jgi:hypothetical protein
MEQGYNPRFPSRLRSGTVPLMPRKALTTKPAGSKNPGMTNAVKEPLAFTPVAIEREAMPPAGKRGGRSSNVPAIENFLASLTTPGTYEMRSPDEDGAHPVNRISQIRKIAGERFKVETSPVDSGKRYRVFVTPVPAAS